jgi:hypothetical protein
MDIKQMTIQFRAVVLGAVLVAAVAFIAAASIWYESYKAPELSSPPRIVVRLPRA